MIATLAALYVKLNILLLFAFLLWHGMKWLASLCRQSLRFNAELKLARYLFCTVLLLPIVALVPGVGMQQDFRA